MTIRPLSYTAPVFVTGGTGFLGRHLVPLLCHHGYRVRLMTRRPDAYPWLRGLPNLEVITGDLRDPLHVQRSIAGCQSVIHAAGLFSMWTGAGNFEAVNVAGTQNVAAAAMLAGVERVIFVSTIAVVGNPQPGRIIDEAHPAQPADPYQKSKLAAENVITQYVERGLPAIILRPGAYYGPLGHYAFNRLFFKDPMRGIIMQMDGGPYIIFPAFIRDVAEMVVNALHRGRIGEIYNICGECLSHREAFDIICEEADIAWPRLNIPGWMGLNFARLLTAIAHFTQREPFWPVGLRSYVFNDWHVTSEKAAAELGFQATPFRDGARATVAWYRAGCPQDVHAYAPNQQDFDPTRI